jgi:hypothetical protein
VWPDAGRHAPEPRPVGCATRLALPPGRYLSDLFILRGVLAISAPTTARSSSPRPATGWPYVDVYSAPPGPAKSPAGAGFIRAALLVRATKVPDSSRSRLLPRSPVRMGGSDGIVDRDRDPVFDPAEGRPFQYPL